jgi:hypothetical protein
MMLMVSVIWFLTLTALLLITPLWTSAADDDQKGFGATRNSRPLEVVAGAGVAYRYLLDRDPVCGVEISRDSAVAAEEYRSAILLGGGDCLEAFLRNPARHALAA